MVQGWNGLLVRLLALVAPAASTRATVETQLANDFCQAGGELVVYC